MYCGVVVLVIVNGQSTTDGDFDKDEISRLTGAVKVIRAEQIKSADRTAKLEGHLAASLDKITKLESQLAAISATKQRDVGKFSSTQLHSRVVESLDCGARGPGFESRCRRKVLGSDGIICKYLPL